MITALDSLAAHSPSSSTHPSYYIYTSFCNQMHCGKSGDRKTSEGTECIRACLVTQSCCLFATFWPVAHQDLLSMGFFRKEYWSRLPFPSPGDLPHQKTEPMSLVSPALQADSLPAEQLGKPLKNWLRNPQMINFKTREIVIPVTVNLCSR